MFQLSVSQHAILYIVRPQLNNAYVWC